MSQNITLLPEDRLNKKNFEEWNFVIGNILQSNKVSKYVESDVIGELEKKLTDLRTNEVQDSSAVGNLKSEITKAKDEDAKAKTIISTNVSYEVIEKIKGLKTAFAIMEKIKNIYGKKKSSDVQFLLKKMYSIHAKNLYECKEVIAELLEVFEKLETLKFNMDEIERIRIIYVALPKSIQNLVCPTEEITLVKFLEKTQYVINFQIYAFNTGNGIKNESSKNKEDYMDIDNIDTVEKDISYFSNSKYCFICKIPGHSTDECIHNNLKKKNKDNNKNQDNSKNKQKPNGKRRRPKGRNSNRRNFNKNKSMANIQYDEFSENEISLENLENNYEGDIDIIELVKENECKGERHDQHNKLNNVQNTPNGSTHPDQQVGQTTWIFDTGASEHITNNKDVLEDYQETNVILRCANNSICEFEGMGTYTAIINGVIIKLDKVLYSKNANKNLLSGIKLAKNGMVANLKSRNEKVYLTLKLRNADKKSFILGTFEADSNNIVKIQMIDKLSNPSINTIIEEEEIIDIDDQSRLLWHRRLGHFYHDDINKYLKLHNIKPTTCLDCKIAKLNRKSHKGETPKATEILETIHSDVMGPISIKSFTGKRYILTFIDEYSRKSWIFLLENKKEVTRITINFFTYLQVQFKYNIKSFHTDQGTEYKNDKILNYCKKHGIVKTFSPPHSPQNNGLAERFNYTIINCARTLLRWAQMSLEFWDYSIKYANSLYNITPHKGIKNKIPNEIFYNKKVDIKYIKVFGCTAYYKDFSQNRVKVDTKGVKGVFLGINNESHCYIIMNPVDFSIHLVNEVEFDESTPSALKANENYKLNYNNLLNNDNYITDDFTTNTEKIDIVRFTYNNSLYNETIQNNENVINTKQNNNDEENSSSENKTTIGNQSSLPNKLNEQNIKTNKPVNTELLNNNNNSSLNRRDKKTYKTSLKRKHSLVESDSSLGNENNTIQHKRINTNTCPTNNIPLKRRNENLDNGENKKLKPSPIEKVKRPSSPLEHETTKRPKFILENIEKLNHRYYVNCSCTFSNGNESIIMDIPLSYKQAISCKYSKYWIKAMRDEIQNFYDNEIMTFIKHLPKGVKPTSTKWVYTIKKDSNGNIVKFKARLVARGFTQRKGTDYELTYSPTLSIDSLKLLIAIASKFNWNIMQLDIKAAYLNAPLDKKIYIPVPPGDKNFGKGYWLLNKALYGLKQSGRQWNIHFTNFLKNNKFTQLLSEPCIFKKMAGKKVVCIIGVYVDDLLITGKDYHIHNIIKKIKKTFRISNCGKANYILGIKIEKQKFNYSISQTQLINEILQKFNITNIRKSKTPCSGENKLNKKDNTPFDKTTYKSAVGSLIYLSRCTRPDISFAVGMVARHSENPTMEDWKKVMIIMKYLNYTKDYKITYKGKGEIVAYTDSDFAGDPKDRKSTSGFIILMNNDPICWQSKEQTVVATSTAEAEYIATAECTKKVLWLRNLLQELFKINKPIKIYTDNLASKITIENGELNNKLKHIEIKFYFNKDNIKNNKINLEYISTEKMLADPLTKIINGPKMTKFTDQIFNKTKILA